MAFDVVTAMWAIKKGKGYTDSSISGIAGGFKYKGSVATMEDLPSDAQQGDEYTVGDLGPYVWDGTNWKPSTRQGPQGPQGDVGPQGPIGPAGKDGDNIVEAGTGIAVDYDAEEKKYTISNTQTSAEWGNIEGSLSNQTDLNSALTTKADLVNGRVPLQQLPEFIVADVVEVQTYEDLPAVGESHTLYHVILTDSVYRWVGAGYVQISQKSQYFSLLIDSNITTMGQLKDKVDSVNSAGDHVFFDLHQLVNEGYVCTVHFWDETVSGTTHHYCEINDLLNDRLYGIKQEWTSSQLVSNYCSSTGLMYDIKKVSINGTALTNDRGFVDIPKATVSKLGVVQGNEAAGININSAGVMNLVKAVDSELENKSSNYKVIVPTNLDKAVMEGLNPASSFTGWTDAKKATARATLGASEEIAVEVW